MNINCFFKNLGLQYIVVLVCCLLVNLQNCAFSQEPSAHEPLSEVIVSADALSSSQGDLPASVTVVQQKEASEAAQSHFADMIDTIPNLSWAGGTNRPRYFQIRGIGELEQYEGAPNPSVAMLVDDFDFSSLGGLATLFDLEQVEVLRGPQGLRYGANALAGVVHLKTNEPTPYLNGNSELSFGNDELVAGGAAIGGPVDGSDGKLQFRVAAYQHSSNGFRNDVFLSRDDTNKRDELTTRLKLKWIPTDQAELNFAYLHIDLNDGFDAFAIDNGLATQSDRPGQDLQRTDGFSLKGDFEVSPQANLISTTNLAESDITYSFDGDWGNNPFWGQFAPYDFFSDNARRRQVLQQEFRLQNDNPNSSQRWLFGLYALRLAEGNKVTQYSDNIPYDFLDSDYASINSAAFAQLEQDLDSENTLSSAFRLENRSAHYFNSRAEDFSPDDMMLGGQIALSHQLNKQNKLYSLISRGYKAGGFNIGSNIPEDSREFSPEYLWNLESGLKSSLFENALETRIALFYDWRRELQAKSALQNDPSDPLAFTFVTQNAARGYNMGSEAEVAWALNQRLKLISNVGLLRAKFTEFEGADGARLDGRDQSDAPSWQYSNALRFQILDNLFTRAEVTAKDRFYFDDAHDQRSFAYELFNASIGWNNQSWAVTLWGKNLFNRNYAVRGFFFGNEPPDFPDKLYIQRGDPRTFGLTINYFF